MGRPGTSFAIACSLIAAGWERASTLAMTPSRKPTQQTSSCLLDTHGSARISAAARASRSMVPCTFTGPRQPSAAKLATGRGDGGRALHIVDDARRPVPRAARARFSNRLSPFAESRETLPTPPDPDRRQLAAPYALGAMVKLGQLRGADVPGGGCPPAHSARAAPGDGDPDCRRGHLPCVAIVVGARTDYRPRVRTGVLGTRVPADEGAAMLLETPCDRSFLR